jgi:RNA polymerase sigma-70 factor (sigma-E family)
VKADDSSGREAEFHAFMTSRWARLVRVAYGLTGDRADAEDLAQTAFSKAYAAWPRVRRADDPDAYLRKILVNAHRGRFRKRRVAETSVEAVPETAVDDGTGDLDRRMVLRSALLELPPGQRAIVMLRYWEGMTESQVAAVLGCSVGNVRSQASRALAKLRTSPQFHDGSRS